MVKRPAEPSPFDDNDSEAADSLHEAAQSRYFNSAPSVITSRALDPNDLLNAGKMLPEA